MTNDIVMISSPIGESGIGDYVEDLTNCFSKTYTDHLTIPINSNNPFKFGKIGIQAAIKNPNVIHVQHEYGQFGFASLMSWIFFPVLYIVTGFRGIPVVVTMHEGLNEGLVTKPFKNLKKIYIRLLNTLIVRKAQRVIFLSERTANEIRQSVDTGQDIVLHHGVQTERCVNISKSEAKERLGYSPDTVVISEPGFIEPRKGSDRLIELAERLSQYEFILAGGPSGPRYHEYVEDLKDRSPENVTITGRLSKEKFHSVFVASDLIVLPYKDAGQGGIINTTNQSGIFNRCATYSKPTLTSKQSYFEAIERDWNAITTCEFDDLDHVEHRILELITNTEVRTQLSKAISEFADAHSFERAANQHENIYSVLLNQQRSCEARC